MPNDFIPRPLGDFAQWVKLQATKRPLYAATLGISATEEAQHAQDDAAVLDKVDKADVALRAATAAVSTRDQAIDNYKAQVRATIARAKTHPAYTEAIGKDCQWLAPADSPDRATLKPTLHQRPSAEGIRLDWSKLGQDGVEVYRRKAGTPTWEKLAFDSRSPYIDTEQGLTGPYEYYVQLMHHDKPVGERSDVVVAVMAG